MISGRKPLRAEQRPTAEGADARCSLARCAASAIRSGSGMGSPSASPWILFYQHEALAWLCEGLGFFASLGLQAVLNDKASKIPFTEDVPPAGMQGVKFSKSASFFKHGEKDERMGLLLCCN
ncbi:NADH dehydrogenase ubiquinone 1 beta subcomplex subunit 8 [Musa troglodytarum]|uniref:NADH dehydrogenase ubiquinone 1 beta subcomplex subunit 8 n=1 Tax=Musa troglodytarum TaxID=320322 RepID=A0A9E7JYZ0_9LILI|nr:NADH dehydrogenase ubiquinone 1 beta subcomplex subunit 8 [Musa troglodytarum]